jgi:hypothetical protein
MPASCGSSSSLAPDIVPEAGFRRSSIPKLQGVAAYVHDTITANEIEKFRVSEFARAVKNALRGRSSHPRKRLEQFVQYKSLRKFNSAERFKP